MIFRFFMLHTHKRFLSQLGCFTLIIQLLPHNTSREDYRGKPEDSLECVLALPHMVAENQQEFRPVRNKFGHSIREETYFAKAIAKTKMKEQMKRKEGLMTRSLNKIVISTCMFLLSSITYILTNFHLFPVVFIKMTIQCNFVEYQLENVVKLEERI